MTPLSLIRSKAEHLARQLPHMTLQAQASEAAHVGSAGRRRAGSGEHFWQYRRYAHEDAADRIDWRRSAKGEALFVRETELETARTFLFWCDPHPGFDWSSETSTKAGNPTKADEARVMMLALGALLSRDGERVGVLGSDRRPSFGKRAVERLGEDLCLADNTPFPGPPKHAAALVIASDFYDPIALWQERLGPLAARCSEGVLVAISDPVEEDFPFEGRTKFTRPGTNLDRILGRAETVREDYQEIYARHREALKALASQLGWRFISHRTDAPALHGAAHLKLAIESLGADA